MSGNDSKDETGGRKFKPAGANQSQEFSQAAGNETNEKARHSEGQRLSKQATPSPDSEKLGGGPAMAEHSKDAKALKGGRKAAAYVKR